MDAEILEKLQEIESNLKLSCKVGLTLDEASIYTGIGRKSLEVAIIQYGVPHSKIGKKTIIYKEYLDEMLKSGIEI